MSRFVLDTSVAIAWYLPESFAEVARTWQTRMLDERVDFIVPTLHYWEFANVLRVFERQGNRLSSIVRDAWDGRTLRTLAISSRPP